MRNENDGLNPKLSFSENKIFREVLYLQNWGFKSNVLVDRSLF